MPKRTTTKRSKSRAARIAAMDQNILDVDGAARLIGVSKDTIYALARTGKIPAIRVGREWRFTRQGLISWISNGTQEDPLAAILRQKTVKAKKRS